MPNSYVNSLVDKTTLSKSKLSDLWKMAKGIADKKFPDNGPNFWRYTTGIFNKAIGPHVTDQDMPDIDALVDQLNTDSGIGEVEADDDAGKLHINDLNNHINAKRKTEKGYAYPSKDQTQKNYAFPYEDLTLHVRNRKATMPHRKDKSADPKPPSLQSISRIVLC